MVPSVWAIKKSTAMKGGKHTYTKNVLAGGGFFHVVLRTYIYKTGTPGASHIKTRHDFFSTAVVRTAPYSHNIDKIDTRHPRAVDTLLAMLRSQHCSK